jgi:inhibitor of cysteine peptidase
MCKFSYLLIITTFFVSLFLISGCTEEKNDPLSASDDSSIESKSPEFKSPESVTIEVGTAFKVSMDSNPTTGYNWSTEVEPDFLKIKSDTYKSESNLIGAGGVQTIEFEALKAGQTKIAMKYMRPWEKEAIKNHEIAVTINPK